MAEYLVVKKLRKDIENILAIIPSITSLVLGIRKLM